MLNDHRIGDKIFVRRDEIDGAEITGVEIDGSIIVDVLGKDSTALIGGEDILCRM